MSEEKSNLSQLISILAIIAFILSVVGAIILLPQIIGFFSNGIFGVTEKYILTSVGIGVVAYILAVILDFLDYTTSSSTEESKFDFISIAKYISGTCVGIVALFYVYIYVII